MNDEARFVLNMNDGVDTLHRSPTYEQCNVDDAKNATTIDARTAAAMIATGHARPCEHCMPTEEHL